MIDQERHEAAIKELRDRSDKLVKDMRNYELRELVWLRDFYNEGLKQVGK